MKCPDCRIKFSGDECPECGWRLSHNRDNSIPPVPTTCMVKGCGADVSGTNTCVNSVTLRDERGHLFTPANSAKYIHYSGGKGYCNPGYTFVTHVTRCNACYHREHGPDWRDEMIAEQMILHPEILRVDWANEDDRRDIRTIIRSATRRLMTHKPRTSTIDAVADDMQITRHVITPEQIVNADTSIFNKFAGAK